MKAKKIFNKETKINKNKPQNKTKLIQLAN